MNTKEWKLVEQGTAREVILPCTIINAMTGEIVTITHAAPPHKPSSTGKVSGEGFLGQRYPSVFGMEFVRVH